MNTCQCLGICVYCRLLKMRLLFQNGLSRRVKVHVDAMENGAVDIYNAFLEGIVRFYGLHEAKRIVL